MVYTSKCRKQSCTNTNLLSERFLGVTSEVSTCTSPTDITKGMGIKQYFCFIIVFVIAFFNKIMLATASPTHSFPPCCGGPAPLSFPSASPKGTGGRALSIPPAPEGGIEQRWRSCQRSRHSRPRPVGSALTRSASQGLGFWQWGSMARFARALVARFRTQTAATGTDLPAHRQREQGNCQCRHGKRPVLRCDRWMLPKPRIRPVLLAPGFAKRQGRCSLQTGARWQTRRNSYIM